MAIFMKYEGIDGESEVRGKRGFVELTSFTWGLARTMSSVKAGSRGDAEVQVNEISVTRTQDSLSALFVQEAVSGKFDKAVEVHFIRTGPNKKPATFLKVQLAQAGISSYSISGAGESGVPTESMSINFVTVTMDSHKVDDALSGVPNTASFDTSTGAPG